MLSWFTFGIDYYAGVLNIDFRRTILTFAGRCLLNKLNKISIAAAIITDKKGRCLLVRKRGTRYFMQPGGKPETGENPEAALIRELEEELNFSVMPEELVSLGRFTDTAANEPDCIVEADIFHIATDRLSFEPTAEIEEAIWFEPGTPLDIELAPLTENHMLPLLKGIK